MISSNDRLYLRILFLDDENHGFLYSFTDEKVLKDILEYTDSNNESVDLPYISIGNKFTYNEETFEVTNFQLIYKKIMSDPRLGINSVLVGDDEQASNLDLRIFVKQL